MNYFVIWFILGVLSALLWRIEMGKTEVGLLLSWIMVGPTWMVLRILYLGVRILENFPKWLGKRI